MKIIENSLIPFKGFTAINLFGVIFVRKGASINDKTVNHEQIHTKQIEEVMLVTWFIFLFIGWITSFKMFIVWFFSYYIWYGIEFFIHYRKLKDWNKAYKNISFEKEAYHNANDLNYLTKRKRFAFIKYFKEKEK